MTQQIKQQYSLDQIKKALVKAKVWEIRGSILNSILASSKDFDKNKKVTKADIDRIFTELIKEEGGGTIFIKAGEYADDKGAPKPSMPTFTVQLPLTEEDDTDGETIYVDIVQNNNNRSQQPQMNFVPSNYQQQPNYVMHGFVPQNAVVPQAPQQDLAGLIAGFEQTTKNALEKQQVEFQKQILEMEYKHRLEELQRKEMDLKEKLGKLEETQTEYNNKLNKLVPDLKDLGGAILNGLFDSAKGLIKKNTLGSSETKQIETEAANVKLGSKVTVDLGENKQVETKTVEMKVERKDEKLTNKEMVLKLLADMTDDEFNETVDGIDKMIQPEVKAEVTEVKEIINDKDTTTNANKDNIND